MHRWLEAADDDGHQIDDGGKEQLAGVLTCGGALEHPIQFLGIERSLHEDAKKDGHRRIQNESFEHIAKYHDPLLGKRDLLLRPIVISNLTHLGSGSLKGDAPRSEASRRGLAGWRQLDPSHPALVTCQDGKVEPCPETRCTLVSLPLAAPTTECQFQL